MRPPGSIKVFGVLNLVFAGLGLLAVALLAFLYFGARNAGWLSPGEIEEIIGNGSLLTYLKISLVIGAIMTVVLLVSGIGLLKLRAWGHKLAIVYAIYGIVNAIVELAVTAAYAQLEAEEIGGGIRGLAYPIILLVFMLRANVRAWFANPYGGSAHAHFAATGRRF